MGGSYKSAGLVRRINELAFGSATDAVKLAFIDPERPELIDGLDLRMVSEVKRGNNGAVEVKLLNRIALLELLAGLLKTDSPAGQGQGGGAESFFTAMDRAAEKLKEKEQ